MRNPSNKNKWKKIAKLFNEGPMVTMTRSPAQIKERWENVLKQKYKKSLVLKSLLYF